MHAWTSALEAKFKGKGKVWGRNEFDVVTKDYDVIYDTPPILLVQDLITAYPESLIILTIRNPQSWSHSIRTSLFTVFLWPTWPLLALLDPNMAGTWWTQTRLVFDAFCGNDYRDTELHKQRYAEHNKFVEGVCPPERLLRYSVSEGWGPLCEFLGVECPGVEFPRVAESEMFMKVHVMFWRACVLNAAENVGLVGLMVVVVVIVLLWLRSWIGF